MVFQKRSCVKDSAEAKEGKTKVSERISKRLAPKPDAAKPGKQLKEDKKSVEESSVSSEELSNDMTPANRASDDSECSRLSSSSSCADNDSSTSSTKKTNLVKIPFEPGLRLEAKDLGNEIWYAVKVVEVDWEEEEILIHFEKWSQRYDEWISMDSSRLRPTQEATTTSKGGKKSSKVFKVGDRVNATWSDSRKYPATVKSVLPGDKFEVLFMDGYTKIIKSARMAKLKASDAENMEQFDPEKLGVFKVPEKPPAPPVLSPLITDTKTIGTKAERRERKRKLNVAELFHRKKRPRKSSPPPSPSKRAVSETEKTADENPPEHNAEEEQPEAKGDNQEKTRQRKTSMDDPDKVGAEDTVPDPSKKEAEVKHAIHEPDAAPQSEKPVEDGIKKDEGESKTRRKIIPKFRESLEEEVKPRRRMKRDGIDGGRRLGMRRGMLPCRMGRKLARKSPQVKKEETYHSENRDEAAVPGTSHDSVSSEAPKIKKEAETEKPVRKSALDGWEPEGEPAYIVESPEGLRKSIIVPDKRLPEGWIKHMIQRKGGHSAGKWDVFFVCPQGRKFRSRHELRNYFEEKGEEFLREQFDFSLGRRKMRWASRDSSGKSSPPGQARAGTGRGKGSGSAVSEEQPIRRVKTLLPKVRVSQPEDGPSSLPEGASPRSPLPPYTTTVAPVPAARLSDDAIEGGVFVGSLKIQMENDAYMCPKDGCNKHFRKENLLQMHIKHYHPEYNKFMGSTPNVADLAYARTIGEPVEDLMPKARYSVASPTFLERINRFEANRKAKTLGVPVPCGLSHAGGAVAAAPDLTLPERKKSLGKDLKLGLGSGGKKTIKGEIENSSSESSLAAEDAVSVAARQDDSPPVLEPILTAAREERKDQQPTIKTLLPVLRTSAPTQDLTLAERLKMRYPSEDSLGEAVLRKDPPVAPQSPQQAAHSQPPVLQQQQPTPPSSQLTMPNLTKSMRTVRRKHMSDFHMEPLMRKRKSAKAPELLPEDADLNEDGSLHSDSSSYRYSRKKMPVVHLEKLQTTTDSNASLEGEDRSKSPLPDSPTKTRVEQLRREEIINCICGYNEEDGLMIQCDLCLCWQHGLCSKIEKETDVPEKYVCPICLNPHRERRSKHHVHDQDWLKEGMLPSFSFRSKNQENIKQRESVLKRTHEMTAVLHQLNQVIHSLRIKLNIAEAPDQHPKLYLWAKSWEDDEADSSQLPVQPTAHSYKRETKPLPEPVLHSLDHEVKLDMSSQQSYGDELKPDLESLDSLPLLHAFGKDTKPGPPTQEQKNQEKTAHETETTKEVEESKVEEKWSKSFSSRNLSYPLPPSAMEEDMCSVSSAEPFQLNLSEDEHVLEERSAGKKLANINPSQEEECRNASLPVSEDESLPAKEDIAVAVDDANTKNTGLSADPTENAGVETKEDCKIAENSQDGKAVEPEVVVQEPKEVVVQEPEEVVVQEPVDDIVQPLEEIVEPIEEVVEETVVSQDDGIVDGLVESREEVVECTEETVPSVEETVDSQEEATDQKEDVVEPPEDITVQDGGSPARIDGHILHQALTNGMSSMNADDAVDSLQLPICQSELMQLASSIANKLEEAESERPKLQEPVPEALIDLNECRTRLLDHIENYQQRIESRLTTIEAQIAALESVDPHSAVDEAPDYYPKTKQTVQMLLRDLLTIQRLSLFN